MKTLYEVNWHYDENDMLVRISVFPIRVLREGILPGCSAVSITAVGSDGRQFQGCPRNYFETEDAAWAQAKEALQETLVLQEQVMYEAKRRIEGLRSILNVV